MRQKEKKQKTFYFNKCNKMNNKKRKNWGFYEIKFENKGCNFQHRLKNYCKTFTDEGFAEKTFDAFK